MSGHTQTPIEPISGVSKAKKVLETLDGLPYASQPFLIQTHDPAVSSMAPSSRISNVSHAFERPKLPVPETPLSPTLCEYLYLKVMQEIKTMGNDIIRAVTHRIDVHKKQIQKILDEDIQKLKERIDQAASNGWWDMFKNTLNAVYAAVTFALGVASIAQASYLVGAALIAAGILSIVNLACTNTGLWDELANYLAHDDEERRKKIGLMIPLALGIISAALGLYGSCFHPALADSLTAKVLNIVSSTLAIVQGTASLGKSISQGKLLYREAEHLKVQTALEDEQMSLQFITTWIENTMAQNKVSSERAGQMLRMIVEANQNVVQFQA